MPASVAASWETRVNPLPSSPFNSRSEGASPRSKRKKKNLNHTVFLRAKSTLEFTEMRGECLGVNSNWVEAVTVRRAQLCNRTNSGIQLKKLPVLYICTGVVLHATPGDTIVNVQSCIILGWSLRKAIYPSSTVVSCFSRLVKLGHSTSLQSESKVVTCLERQPIRYVQIDLNKWMKKVGTKRRC